jgi:hypothetical protein
LKNIYKGTPTKGGVQGIIYKPPMQQNFMGTLNLDETGTNHSTAAGDILTGVPKRPLKTSIGMATTTMTSLFDQTIPFSAKNMPL